MKKYMALILLSISALVLTSCANTPVQTPVDEPVVEKPAEDEEKPEVLDVEDKKEIGVAPGMQAPNFTLLGRDDEEISLSDYKGKITFLNFWATTCPFCVDEMPDLEEFYKAHLDEDDVALLGVNMTKTWEKKPKDALVEWLDNEGLTFPVVFDVDGVQAVEWSARSLPMTFVIDEEGTSLGAIIGKTDIKTLEGILAEVRAARDIK